MPKMSQKKVVLLSAAVFFALSDFALAAGCDPSWPMFCNPIGSGTVRDVIIILIRFLLSVIGVISLLFIIVAGMKYVTSAGNEESVKSAKHTLTAAATGLALALLAYSIVTALETILAVR